MDDIFRIGGIALAFALIAAIQTWGRRRLRREAVDEAIERILDE